MMWFMNSDGGEESTVFIRCSAWSGYWGELTTKP
jgi:hypothetical protein